MPEGYYQLQCVYFNDRIYQLWVTPGDEILRDYIRNDFDERVMDEEVITLATGSTWRQVCKYYNTALDKMKREATLDGYTATEIPNRYNNPRSYQ